MKRRLLVGLAALLGAAVFVQEGRALVGYEEALLKQAALKSLGASLKSAAWNATAEETARTAGAAVLLRSATGFNPYVVGGTILAGTLLPLIVTWATGHDNEPSMLGDQPGPFADMVGLWTVNHTANPIDAYWGGGVTSGTLDVSSHRIYPPNPSDASDWVIHYSGGVGSGGHVVGTLAGSGEYVEQNYTMEWHEDGVTIDNSGRDGRASDTWTNDQIHQMIVDLEAANDQRAEELKATIAGLFAPPTGAIPDPAVDWYEDEAGDLQPGAPSASDAGTSASPSPSASAVASPSPSSSPSADPSASPSPSPSPSVSASPSAAPSAFNDENFVKHFVTGVAGKFPADLLIDTATYTDPAMEVEFFGYTYSLEWLKPIFAMFFTILTGIAGYMMLVKA